MGINFDGTDGNMNVNFPNLHGNKVNKGAEKPVGKIDVPVGQPQAPAEAPKITELTDIRTADIESCRNAFGVHFTRNTAVTDELRLVDDFRNDILPLVTGKVKPEVPLTREDHDWRTNLVTEISLKDPSGIQRIIFNTFGNDYGTV